ncbi:hypothetical protein NUW58_g7114 [Xylaria curta]|uniref:Uncharacterized protein n=1 Tax=Xylaria curta TaxID=42375 RepID=A0ACC1NLT3_9PEZI|nr:hypothetical protein NUW58_g7114 [Xylaria curta]
MPGNLDTEAQFRFLISCIRHSTAGKVDFEEVRKECDIISKGAAAKRYERLMKTHNIGTGGVANGVKKEAKDAEETKKPKGGKAKKRKLKEVDEDEGDTDEPVKSEPGVKGEVKDEDATVKLEHWNDEPPNTTHPHCPSFPSRPTNTASPATAQNDDDDEVLFVSATEKRCYSNTHDYDSDYRPSRTHPHPYMLFASGSQSADHTANVHIPQQLDASRASQPPATTASMAPSNLLPYGFAPTTWVVPHDRHGYLWQS